MQYNLLKIYKMTILLVIVTFMLISCENESTKSIIAEDDYVFELIDEWNGSCEKKQIIDVNLGHSAEKFVEAAHCQCLGFRPDSNTINMYTEKLRNLDYVRRIDIIHTLCQLINREDYELIYSDPWKSQIELRLEDDVVKKNDRDIGAVMMFFFNCPNGVNCGMDWANTHAPGMDVPVKLYGFGDKQEGLYDPKSNAGFWYRELLDAQYAGLDFLLLNTYGPDLDEGGFEMLELALDAIDDPIKLALFDDTWTWGEPWFGEFWEEVPNLAQTELCAQKLYNAKWKPFFEKVPEQVWYLYNFRPLIYFYNAGKLQPRNRAAGVIRRMKQLFVQDFEVEPFVVVDGAFFEDPEMKFVADGRFNWFTLNLPGNRSRYTMNGTTIDHSMVRWDALGRSNPGAIASESDLIKKGPEILSEVLQNSQDADILVIATWNDLGEGTGINRNYDYYYHGEWLKPNYFMDIIRASQLDL